MTEELAHFLSGPVEVAKSGYDGKVFEWYVGPNRVEVRFTDTAWEAGPEGVSRRAERAINTVGRSEAMEFLNWKTVPEWIEFSTDNLPWIEGGELAD